MAVGQRFSDSEEFELLEPYSDGDGLVAGYRVERLLSRDPWRHTTYEASMPDGRRVALKLLNVRSDSSRGATKRFQRRLQLRASIHHPHLLSILDWGKLDDRYYLAMALCRAPTLANHLHAAPLKVTGALRLLGQLADALETAHAEGLVHRDLAPENVLVEPVDGGHVWLGDFGVADPEWATGLLELTGSTPYLSPERLRDEPLGPESNVYSLACMLVECLTGSPPYASEHEGTVAYAHVAEPPPRLSERHPELPASIDDVVAAAMAKDPAERLTSARQVVTAAAAALRVQVPVSLGYSASPPSGRQGASLPGGASGDGAAPWGAPPESPRAGGPSVPKRSPLGSPVRADGLLAALRRDAFALTLIVTVACGGVLGFLLGRSEHDAAGPASNPPLAEEPVRSGLLRASDVALEQLDARRAVTRRRLAAAPTPRAQAAEAERLVAAYEAARRMLPRGPGPGAQLASALNEAERAYGRLAATARRGDRRGYSDARRAVGRSEGDLQQAILRLNRG